MTIRFAAATAKHHRMIGRVSTRNVQFFPANDNGTDPLRQHLIGEALRHFSRHGLRAAQQAREEAEAALAEDDREGYEWWLSICRQFDRRMAAALERGIALP